MLRRRTAPAQVTSGASEEGNTARRVLVAGWFSWPDCGTTAGDVLARDVACTWLDRVGIAYEVANHANFGGGVDWRRASPDRYSDLLFVCGPIHAATPWREMAKRFPNVHKIGLDVTLIEPVAAWNPFDVLLERDSDRGARPDLAFASTAGSAPVIGLVLVPPYTPEYPKRDMQPAARQAAVDLVARSSAAAVPIDTELCGGPGTLRTPAEVESVIARMDAVITTRLHGLVFALKNGVPALAIDPVAGGSKILRQAEAVGWPAVRTADALSEPDLDELLAFCLTAEARDRARACTETALAKLSEVEHEFRRALEVE